MIHSLSGGGAETQLKLLANELIKRNISTAICCVDDTGKKALDSRVKVYKSLKSNKYNFSLFAVLNRAIKRFKPDVVHAWLPASMTIPAMIIAYYNRSLCVFSYRNKMQFHRFLSYPEYVSAWMFADGIVSNNPIENSIFLFRKLFKSKNGVEISNAVSVPDKFKKKIKNRQNRECLKLLFVGRVTAQKNWKCLLEAISLIDGEASVKLVICGDGEEMSILKKMIKELHLENQISLKGFQPHIFPIMTDSDALVLPSFYEGMPNVLLEAMCIGLPCIVSDIPAHREIIKNNNDAVLFFNPAFPDDLAMKIKQFFEYSDSSTMISEGLKIVQNYSPEKMSSEYYRVYTEMFAD